MMAYSFTHTVKVKVSQRAVWQFWTNVENWQFDSDIESVTLNGPFQAGTHGTTKTRSSGPVQWQIVAVNEPASAIIEIPIPGATGRFAWSFVHLATAETEITQQVTLEGEQAAAFAAQMGESFEQGIRDGMEKLGSVLESS